MSNTVIKVENLSKQYRLGQIGTGTIRDDFARFWARVRGKEDPTLKIGQTNSLSSNQQFNNSTTQRLNDPTTKPSDYIWALRDINFSVQQGEAIGIIGKNGAGKSTLLKLLSKVTAPTTGNIKIKGRIASLLEVGTGFHPELSGRENIFLNGAIMGMTKDEIRNKFDEIVDFSGVENYIDTPVKRYSSGMYVRLAFAVAAHLEPEILVVDEVLAVGDAEFQKKCLGKMGDVAKGGRTVLFVSHNMTAIADLCTRCVVLKNGCIDFLGQTNNAMKRYLDTSITKNQSKDLSIVKNRTGNGIIRFISYKILNDQNNEIDFILTGQSVTFVLEVLHTEDAPVPPVHFSILFVDENEKSLFHVSNTVANGEEFKLIFINGKAKVKCVIPKFPLHTGEYYFHFYAGVFQNIFDNIPMAGSIQVEPGNYYATGRLPYREQGDILVENSWSILE